MSGLPIVYIYPTKDLFSPFKAFEECTDVENLFINNMRKFPQAETVEEAHVAFFPITLGSKLHPHSGENVQYLWRKKYSKMMAGEQVRKQVPHFLLLSYVLYKVNLEFIPKDCKVLCYETEVTFGPGHIGDMGCGTRMITIPYILSQQSHPSAGLMGPRPGPDILTWEHFASREKLCYIGNAVRQGFCNELVLQVCKKHYGPRFDHWTPLSKPNVFACYGDCKLALVLRGDTPTRKAFYHALAYGCVPVVFRSTLSCYGELFGGALPIQDMCVTIPDPQWDDDKEVYTDTVQRTLDAFLQDPVAQRVKFDAIRRYGPDLDYFKDVSGISRPVMCAVRAVLGDCSQVRRWVPEAPLVFYYHLPAEFNNRVFPVQISERETVSSDSVTSQYSLEIHWDRAVRQRCILTSSIARASFAFVPLYTFLIGWKDRVFDNRVIAQKLNWLLAYMKGWHANTTTPHVLVYSDVLWDTPDSFLKGVRFPVNTRLIALESCSVAPKTLVSPYVTEWGDGDPVLERQGIDPRTSVRPHLLCYIGKEERTGGFQDPRFATHLIAQSGWRSVNDEALTLACRSLFLGSRFSWQPHGDRRTRRSFYQSVQLGCVPVVTRACLQAYLECHPGLADVALVVDDHLPLADILDFVAAVTDDEWTRMHRACLKERVHLGTAASIDRIMTAVVSVKNKDVQVSVSAQDPTAGGRALDSVRLGPEELQDPGVVDVLGRLDEEEPALESGVDL